MVVVEHCVGTTCFGGDPLDNVDYGQSICIVRKVAGHGRVIWRDDRGFAATPVKIPMPNWIVRQAGKTPWTTRGGCRDMVKVACT